MKDTNESCEGVNTDSTANNLEQCHHDAPGDSSRRSFLGKIGLGGAAAVALAAGIPLEPLIEGKHGEAEASVVPYGASAHANASWRYRDQNAENERI